MVVGKARERVLVFGDDMRIFLAVVRSLGRAGKEVHAAPLNWHSPALGSKYIAEIHRLPRYSDDPEGWRAAVIRLLQEHAFDLVIPCCDQAILPLDTHRDDFAGTRLAIPSRENMPLFFDKECTRALCAELGVRTAVGQRLAAEDTAPPLARRFGLPLVIKPRKSYWIDQLDASGKVWIVESEGELERVLLGLPDRARYLVEGYFEGVGVGVSVLAENGVIRHAFQHRRLRQGKGGNSSHRVSEPVNDELLAACEAMCARTGHTGVCMFEFRVNGGTGDWILVETNARFWGSSPLPLSLGVNFPLYLYDLLVHGKQHTPVAYQAGVRCRNVVLDGYNLLVGMRNVRLGTAGSWLREAGEFVSQPVRWLTGQERSDTFVRDDLWPGFLEFGTLGRSLAQKFTRTKHQQPRRRASERGPGVLTGRPETPVL